MLRLIAFFTIIIAIVLAILGVILALSGWMTHTTNDVALGVALIVVPLLALFFVRRLAVLQGRAAFNMALQTFAADHSAWYYGSGLALSSVRRQVLVAGPAEVRTYAFDDFVGMEQIFTRDTPYTTGGPFAAITVMIALMRIIIGYFTDGMFLHFRDGSKWQIAGLRKTAAQQWAERLVAAGVRTGPGAQSIVTSR